MRRMISCPRAVRDWLLRSDPTVEDAACTSQRRPLLFFVFCLLAYGVYLVAMQPGWVLGGEIWAEAGTNYFPNAGSPSLAVRFLSTDAGYIPLPQRILAYAGHALNLPARSIPYYYTWSAILITGAMVAAFCLRPFRVLVKNDFLRLFTAIAVLLVADFQTRTFINFTYFATFFIAIVSALALADMRSEVPRWAWSIPVLMISKPAVLSALPAMILAALVSRNRFRLIALAATLTGVAQVVQMMIIYPNSFFIWHKYSTAQKVVASIEYFFGFLGSFFLGRGIDREWLDPVMSIGVGIGLLCACFVTVLKKRNNACALILIGLVLVYFNLLLNSFALSAKWNVDNMKLIVEEPLWRYNIGVYFGVVLVVVGWIAAVAEAPVSSRSWQKAIAPALFLSWFLGSGWCAASRALNSTPDFPVLNSSQWQFMAEAIDSGQAVCVPVDPIDMMFERDCRQLNSQVGGFQWPTVFNFQGLSARDGGSEITLEPPPSTLGRKLISLALVLKPEAGQSVMLHAKAALMLKDGTVRYLAGFRQLQPSGGLVMVAGNGTTPVDEIQAVTFQFSTPVELGYSENWGGYQHVPVVFWMGN